jgi:hypothetical protein
LKDDENKKTILIIQMISNKIDNNKKKTRTKYERKQIKGLP